MFLHCAIGRSKIQWNLFSIIQSVFYQFELKYSWNASGYWPVQSATQERKNKIAHIFTTMFFFVYLRCLTFCIVQYNNRTSSIIRLLGLRHLKVCHYISCYFFLCPFKMQRNVRKISQSISGRNRYLCTFRTVNRLLNNAARNVAF